MSRGDDWGQFETLTKEKRDLSWESTSPASLNELAVKRHIGQGLFVRIVNGVWVMLYLQFCGHCELGCCQVERMVERDKQDKGEDHGIVSDDASDLK